MDNNWAQNSRKGVKPAKKNQMDSNGCTQKLPIFANIASVFTELYGMHSWIRLLPMDQEREWKLKTKPVQWCLEFTNGCSKKTMYKMKWEGANTTLGNIFCPTANHEVTTLDLHWSHHVPTRKKNQVNIMRYCKPWQGRLRYTFFVKFIKLKPHFEIQRTPCMGCFVLPLCPESFLYITRLVVFCSLVGFFLCLNDVF